MNISFKNKSINRIIFVSYFVFITLILLFFGYILNSAYTNNSLTQLQSSILTEINAKNDRLMNIVDKNINICLNLCEDANVKLYTRKFPESDEVAQLDMEQRLNYVLQPYWILNQEIFKITVYVNNKKYVSNPRNAIQPIEKITKQPWFNNLMSLSSILIDGDQLSESYPDFKNRLVIFSKITDNNISTLGYISIILDKNIIYNQYIAENSSTQQFAIDISGNIILPVDTKPDISVLKDITALNGSGNKKIKIDGTNYLLSYSDTNRQGWKTVYLKKYSELHVSANNISKIIIILFIIFTAIAFFITKIIAKIIAKPIVELSDSMLNFDTVVTEPVNSAYNEIEYLNTSFGTLKNKITMQINEIKQTENEKKQAEIKALQAQINPHFLYNTLHSISWYAIDKGVPQIAEILNKLSKLCKMQYNFKSNFCTIAEEQKSVMLYLDLQRDCFKKTFTYSFEVPVEFSSLYMPKFLLQPIVENSIIHGFSNIIYTGNINVSIYMEDELYIKIADNGSGIDENIANQLTNQQYKPNKYGLYNINERIKLLCGEKYGLYYESSHKHGTNIVINLPVISNLENLDNIKGET